MRCSFAILLLFLASTSAWQYINVPKSRPNNCGCINDNFCKVVYVNPKTIEKAEKKFERIILKDKGQILDVTFDDLNENLGAGIAGTLVEKDGRPYNIEPCRKNTDNERQFHRIISAHLMVKTEDDPTKAEERQCCRSADTCDKVVVNFDLFNQFSVEKIYLETSINPKKRFNIKTANFVQHKQNKKLSQLTTENVYLHDNGHHLFTLVSNGEERYAVMTTRGGPVDKEHFSLRQCGDGWFWRSAPKDDYEPTSRGGAGGGREESAPSFYDLYGDEDDYVASGSSRSAPQGADTCYFHNVFYCKLRQDWYVGGGEGIELDSNNSTDEIGQNWCSDQCLATASCSYFTWTRFRKFGMCYLMTDCEEDRSDPCLTEEPQVCMSGPKDCSAVEPNRNCTTLVDHGPGFVDWQCTDYLGNFVWAYHIDSIPWGTVCVQSCNSWRAHGSNKSYPIEAHLVSKCQQNGTWSNTVAYDGQGTLLYPTPKGSVVNPTSDYPTPDDPKNISLSCQCETLFLKWPKVGVMNNLTGTPYDPNTELITDFLCKYELNNQVLEIMHNNTCTLLCDNYLTAAVRCYQGRWTGRPELGFWCQNEPISPGGPQDTINY